MPIEIRELVIRATVDPKKEKAGGPAAGKSAPATQDVVAECVEQVLEILRREKER